MNRAKQLPLWGAYVLLAYMPFHVFLSQSLSELTGGLSVWKLAKDVLIAALALFSVVMVWYSKAYRNNKFNLFVGLTVGYVVLHALLFIILRDTSVSVAGLATMYNVRPLLLLLIGLAAALLLGKKLQLNSIIKIVLIVSTVVAALGVIQYFLPTDILTHFGYSEARGVKPSFLIDNKADLPRIMSTIREPNSLGAFLVVPILVLFYKFLTARRKLLFAGLLLLHGLAMLLTFSRSAWLTTIIAWLSLIFLLYRKALYVFCKRHIVWLALGLVLVCAGLFMLRDQYFVQNTLFHSDENTVAQLDSNEKHLGSLEHGVSAIVDHPEGYGPGTAGPVSMHTSKPFITENYYLQLGYEVGLVGLFVFIAVCVLVFLELRLVGSWESKALIAALIGYAVCNLLLHTWANEAVVTQWWLLAGLVIGSRSGSARRAARQSRPSSYS